MNKENYEKLKQLAKNKDDSFFDLLIAVGLAIVCTTIVESITKETKKGEKQNA